VVEAGVIEDWARVNPRVFTLQVNDPSRYVGLHLTATIKDKQWHLHIEYHYIATFQTFEELDGMVPVLVNGYLNRSDV